jgi:hypothetical protein
MLSTLDELLKLLTGETPAAPSLDYYNLSGPDKEKLEDRQRRIKEITASMGAKHLLAEPIKKRELVCPVVDTRQP